MSGLAIITEACIDVKDRACVDVCPVQCIYEYDAAKDVLFSEDTPGSGDIATTQAPNGEAIAVFGDRMLYVNTEECTACTACYQPDVCPVGAIYPEQDCPTAARGPSTTRTTPTRGTTTASSPSTRGRSSPRRATDDDGERGRSPHD